MKAPAMALRWKASALPKSRVQWPRPIPERVDNQFWRKIMTLQSKLDAFKADFEAGKPPYNVPRSVIDTMRRATSELIASGAAGRARKAGDKAPSFVLNDPDGRPVSSAELLAAGPLVVS